MSSGWAGRRPAPKNRQLYGSQAWKNVRLSVLARDGWVCQVRQSPNCRPDLRVPRNGHCDHVIPVAQGGAALDPWNLRACCGPCNVWLGARLGRSRQTKPPQPPSREW
jgi:5-methylcytosine-specific restriction endonuclease McrA